MENPRKRKACTTYLTGKSRKAHKLRRDLEDGLRATQECTESTVDSPAQCTTCPPVLTTLKPAFVLMVRQNAELRHRKRVLPNPRKPEKLHYRNLVAQNSWIRASLFDALGNYKYCSACIIHTLGIGSQRLSRQRSIKRREALTPLVDMSKSEVVNDRLENFVVMPDGVDNFIRWWAGVEATDQVKVRYPHAQHGLAQKPSNSEKRDVREDFLKFIDENSQPTGRSKGSAGAHYYFSPKFTRIGEPTKSEKNYEQKASHSLLCEFNRSQQEQGREGCSERSAFRWLKEDRPKYTICPHQTDYCDQCKALNERINKQKTTLQRLRHSGDCSDERLREHEALMEQAQKNLAEHKQEAQEALEHYKFTTQKCKRDWKAIVDLASKDDLDATSQTRLLALQESFTLVLSADYQMTKLTPFWGLTAQPAVTYYLRKVSHDLFGIVDHRDETKHVSIFDERIGPKNTDHTVSLLTYYIQHSGLVPPWVKRVCIFMDNAASTNKNRYLIGWAFEMVQHGVLETIRLPFLVTGHTKFAPDRVFASIANSYSSSDVFNCHELATIVSRYATVMEETGVNILPWRQKLDTKYAELSGIRKRHDFFFSQNSSGNTVMKVRDRCGSGVLQTDKPRMRRGSRPETECFPDPTTHYTRHSITSEKNSDVLTMYSRFISEDRWPDYISIQGTAPTECHRRYVTRSAASRGQQ